MTYRETSREAYIDSLKWKTSIEARAFRIIRAEPSTADEVQRKMDGTHQTVSAVVSGLWNKGIIEWTGEFRATRSGRQAYVMRTAV